MAKDGEVLKQYQESMKKIAEKRGDDKDAMFVSMFNLCIELKTQNKRLTQHVQQLEKTKDELELSLADNYFDNEIASARMGLSDEAIEQEVVDAINKIKNKRTVH